MSDIKSQDLLDEQRKHAMHLTMNIKPDLFQKRDGRAEGQTSQNSLNSVGPNLIFNDWGLKLIEITSVLQNVKRQAVGDIMVKPNQI